MGKKDYLKRLFNYPTNYEKMPPQVKTMRDIWDETREEKEAKRVKGYKNLTFGENLDSYGIKILPPEIEKYYAEYLVRRQTFLETKAEIARIFTEYEGRLGDAGFSKIKS